jgi:hypothetical protein
MGEADKARDPRLGRDVAIKARSEYFATAERNIETRHGVD